jgi:nitronate monooxygenase
MGVLGLDWREDRASVEREIAAVAGSPAIPFGMGLVTWALDEAPHLLDLAIEARPRFVCLSFGDPAPHAGRLIASGIELVAQVQDRAGAVAAVRAGASVVVAQGTEAGGHTGRVGTLTLLQTVLDAVDVPVIAAGGIGSGRGAAAAIAAGAAGVWVGTAFLFAHEARVTQGARAKLAAANEGDTVLTHVFDRVQGLRWPEAFPARALKNRFSERYQGREQEIDDRARAAFQHAKAAEDYDVANVYAGEAVGLGAQARPAAEIVRAISERAEKLLRAVGSHFQA